MEISQEKDYSNRRNMGILSKIDDKIGSLFKKRRIEKVLSELDVHYALLTKSTVSLLSLEKKIDTLMESTKSIQSILGQTVVAPEKNKIEEAVIPDLDLSSGEHVPIMSGMKVQIEGENQTQEIRLS